MAGVLLGLRGIKHSSSILYSNDSLRIVRNRANACKNFLF